MSPVDWRTIAAEAEAAAAKDPAAARRALEEESRKALEAAPPASVRQSHVVPPRGHEPSPAEGEPTPDLFAPAYRPLGVKDLARANPNARRPRTTEPPIGHQPGSPTSRKSATLILPRFGTLLRRTYDLIAKAAERDDGLTRQELADTGGMLLQSVCRTVDVLRTNGWVKGDGWGVGTTTNVPPTERLGREVIYTWGLAEQRLAEKRRALGIPPPAST